MKTKKISYEIIFLILLFSAAHSAFSQTSAFNFQGRLNDGSSAANGNYDFQFKLFDAITGGSQISTTVVRSNLQVINGVFSTTLDFGAAAFAGGNRFLEISVRPFNSPNAYVVLGARQQILSVPYAVRATNATQADNSTNALNAATSQNSFSLGGVTASNYARLNFPNQGDIVSAANMAAGGNMTVGGNTIQLPGSNGFVKAMVVVDDDLTTGNLIIERCYNGVTGASTPATCGFTITTNSQGVYTINLGFQVNNRFASAIGRYFSGSTNIHNIGVNYRFPANNNQVIEVFTFPSGNSDDTIRADFTLIIY